MPAKQLTLQIENVHKAVGNTREKLADLLASDLDFHDQFSGYGSHNFHSFPAKFPPQLPRKFIAGLTKPGDVVLDPMSGSGTTALEAFLAGRRAIALDIDPLALLITQVKVTPLDSAILAKQGAMILENAKQALRNDPEKIAAELDSRWEPETREFVNYWFAHETQLAIQSLLGEIERIDDANARLFFMLVLSAIIITKTGGVSLALDLGHTRPHRAKFVVSKAGEVLLGEEFIDNPDPRLKNHTKNLRSALDEFEKRFQNNLKGLITHGGTGLRPAVIEGDAQHLPLEENTVDLIVTSPPYASNAIDYMRAHKFSLVWLGYRIHELGMKRGEYIGGESIADQYLETLPEKTAHIVARLRSVDPKKGDVLHRYYSEMTRVIREMHRVLKPGKSAIVVVGNSIIRGQNTETHSCLADIGQSIGFEIPKIGVRNLDRDRRMMPAGNRLNRASQIQQRMHEEYVIGFYKPR